MGKMNELSLSLNEALDNMIRAGEAMAESARAMKKYFALAEAEADVEQVKEVYAPEVKTGFEPTEPASAEEEDPVEKETEPDYEEKALSKEEVRGILAAIAAKDGGKHKIEVKALVQKYGNGGSLTDVPAESYADLVAEVEALV